MSAMLDELGANRRPADRRYGPRRKLYLEMQGWGGLGAPKVAVLDLSTTGLLIRTSYELTTGERVDLDLPGTGAIQGVIKWSSSPLFGCQFNEPISRAAVSAASLAAAPLPTGACIGLENAPIVAVGNERLRSDEQVAFRSKMRWIVGLCLLSWVMVGLSALLAWQYLS